MADEKLNVSPEESPQICLPFVRVLIIGKIMVVILADLLHGIGICSTIKLVNNNLTIIIKLLLTPLNFYAIINPR